MTSSRVCRPVAAACLALLAGFASTRAAAYTGVYVFGDSLSDIGRVAALTGGFPGPSPTPSLNYAPGRFSNGPVAVETLTLDLTGAPLTLAHDYAYGGARTGTDNNSAALPNTGLQSQVAMFTSSLGGAKTDPNALYVVWAGSNDFSDPTIIGNPAAWGQVITNIETAIGNLAADGATHFLVPNLPNLGLTPRAALAGPATALGASQASGAFDQLLAANLTSFDLANPSFEIKQFDVYSLLTTIVTNVKANGSYLGITDVTSECQLGCADPSHSLFWDDEHPTAAAHAILGNAFAAALVPEPQTNAMLLAGLGVVGWAASRRRRAAA